MLGGVAGSHQYDSFDCRQGLSIHPRPHVNSFQVGQQAHQNLDAMLDDLLNNMSVTQKQAQDQQATMQALDQQNASAF